MHRIPSPYSRQSGFSLIAVLVGLAVVVGALLPMMQLVANQTKSQINRARRIEIEAVKAMIWSGVSCDTTFPTTRAAACATSTYLTVRDRGGRVLVAGGPATKTDMTRFGSFAARAECGADGDIIVRLAPLKAGATLGSTTGSDFIPDPLTNVVADWGSPASLLYPQGIGLCMASKSNVLSTGRQSWQLPATGGSHDTSLALDSDAVGVFIAEGNGSNPEGFASEVRLTIAVDGVPCAGDSFAMTDIATHFGMITNATCIKPLDAGPHVITTTATTSRGWGIWTPTPPDPPDTSEGTARLRWLVIKK